MKDYTDNQSIKDIFAQIEQRVNNYYEQGGKLIISDISVTEGTEVVSEGFGIKTLLIK